MSSDGSDLNEDLFMTIPSRSNGSTQTLKRNRETLEKTLEKEGWKSKTQKANVGGASSAPVIVDVDDDAGQDPKDDVQKCDPRVGEKLKQMRTARKTAVEVASDSSPIKGTRTPLDDGKTNPEDDSSIVIDEDRELFQEAESDVVHSASKNRRRTTTLEACNDEAVDQDGNDDGCASKSCGGEEAAWTSKHSSKGPSISSPSQRAASKSRYSTPPDRYAPPSSAPKSFSRSIGSGKSAKRKDTEEKKSYSKAGERGSRGATRGRGRGSGRGKSVPIDVDDVGDDDDDDILAYSVNSKSFTQRHKNEAADAERKRKEKNASASKGIFEALSARKPASGDSVCAAGNADPDVAQETSTPYVSPRTRRSTGSNAPSRSQAKRSEKEHGNGDDRFSYSSSSASTSDSDSRFIDSAAEEADAHSSSSSDLPAAGSKADALEAIIRQSLQQTSKSTTSGPSASLGQGKKSKKAAVGKKKLPSQSAEASFKKGWHLTAALPSIMPLLKKILTGEEECERLRVWLSGGAPRQQLKFNPPPTAYFSEDDSDTVNDWLMSDFKPLLQEVKFNQVPGEAKKTLSDFDVIHLISDVFEYESIVLLMMDRAACSRERAVELLSSQRNSGATQMMEDFRRDAVFSQSDLDFHREQAKKLLSKK